MRFLAAVRPLAAAAAVPLCACATGPRRPVGTPLGVAAAAPAEPASVPESPAETGSKLYRSKGCVMCHGDDAKGGVPNRYSLGGTIPALESVATGYSEDELKEKIRAGVPSVAKKDPQGHVPILIMPSWRDKLADEEIDAIVAYLFSLAPKGEGGSDDF